MSSTESAIQRIVGMIISEATPPDKKRRSVSYPQVDPAASTRSVELNKFLFDPAPEKGDRTHINTVIAENEAAALSMDRLGYTQRAENALTFSVNKRSPGFKGLPAIRDLTNFSLISQRAGDRIIILSGREIEKRIEERYAHLPTVAERTKILHNALIAKLTTVTILLNSLSDLEYEQIYGSILSDREQQAEKRGTTLTSADRDEIAQQATEAHGQRTIPLESAKRRIQSIKMQSAHFFAGYLATKNTFINDVGAQQTAESEEQLQRNLLSLGGGRAYGAYVTQLQGIGRGSGAPRAPSTVQAMLRGTQADPQAIRGDDALLISLNAQSNRLLGMQGLSGARAEKGKGVVRVDIEKGRIDRSVRDLDLVWDVEELIKMAKADAKLASGSRVMTPEEAARAARRLSGEEAARAAGKRAVIIRQRGEAGDKKPVVSAFDVYDEQAREEQERLERLRRSGQTATEEIRVDSNTAVNAVERVIMSAVGQITRELRSSREFASASEKSLRTSGASYAATIAAFILPVAKALTAARWCDLSDLANMTIERRTTRSSIVSAAKKRPTPTQIVAASHAPLQAVSRAPSALGMVRPATRIHEFVLDDIIFSTLPMRQEERNERFGNMVSSPQDPGVRSYEHNVSTEDILNGVRKVHAPPTYGAEFADALGAYIELLTGALRPIVVTQTRTGSSAVLDDVKATYAALGGDMSSLISDLATAIRNNPRDDRPPVPRPIVEYIRNSVLDPIRDAEVSVIEANNVSLDQAMATPSAQAAEAQAGGAMTGKVFKAAEKAKTDVALDRIAAMSAARKEGEAFSSYTDDDDDAEENRDLPIEDEDEDEEVGDNPFPSKLNEARTVEALLQALRQRASLS